MKIADIVVERARDTRTRRLTYLIVALISAVLIFFPRPYLARARIVPQDTSASAASTTALLGALGGNSQSLGSLLVGGRPSNDLYLVIGKSDSVTENVIESLKLVGAEGWYSNERDAKIDLKKHVDVHMLLGGVMEIETKLYDAQQAQRLTAAYTRAISQQLARFGRQIIENKKKIVERRFADATGRVAQAEGELNAYRRANNLAEPEQQLSAELIQRATLQARLQAKQVELETARQFRGPESTELAAIQSDINTLRSQIAQTARPATDAAGPNVAGLSALDTRYYTLFRNLRFQQNIYDVYQRSAEQVEVEELAVESASYIQVIDPAHIDPDRQFNVWAIALFATIVLLALFTEWYAPATGLFRNRNERGAAADEYHP